MYFFDFPIISTESELPLYLFSIGLHELQPHIVREDGFSYPQILYCTKGSGILVLGGNRCTIKPYTAFFLPAGCPHEYYPQEDIWDIHWVAAAGFAAEDILRHFGFDEPRIFQLENIGVLEHNFRKMHEALAGDRIFGNYRAAGYLYDFLIELYRLTLTVNTGVAANSAVVRAIDHINNNFKDEITMEQLCEVSGVSKQHLCRLFRAALNSRPMEYAAKRRIQAAKELLSNTNISVEDIALDTGFCTSSYFCKLFKRYEGITPTQFRRENGRR